MSQPHIRLMRPEDHATVLDIHNRLHPHAPPVPVEEYREWIHFRPGQTVHRAWVAERGGRVAGSVELEEEWQALEKGVFSAALEVDAHARGNGIGTRLYEEVLAEARKHSAKRLYTYVAEGDVTALAFGEHRGFIPTGRIDKVSRLTVAGADLTALKEREARLLEKGISIMTLEEAGTEDEELLRGVQAMEDETSRDVPASEEYQSMPFELWRKRNFERTGRSARHFWIALHKSNPVGMARLGLRGTRAAFNGFTAVMRDYRGMGLAGTLKLRSIVWCRDNGIEHIYTDNDVENAPMLAINRALGYERLPGEIELVKEPV